jgi:flavorubredoxin
MDVPTTTCVPLARETFLIPNLAPAGPDAYLYVNSLVIRGAEPVIVDTGAPVHRERWLEQVFSLVDPADVRWLFLSHDDGDHTGSLHEVLAMCPNATLVTNFFTDARLAIEHPLPKNREVWLEAGGSFVAGDRRLRLVLPPIFDGPTTRGVLDESTGVLWAVDAFAAFTPGAVYGVADIPAPLYDGSFSTLNSLVSPWHQWLDRTVYHAHVDAIEMLAPDVVASAHGPVLTGPAIHDAFDRVRAMAGAPRVEPPGQPVLEEILAAVAAVAA